MKVLVTLQALKYTYTSCASHHQETVKDSYSKRAIDHYAPRPMYRASSMYIHVMATRCGREAEARPTSQQRESNREKESFDN